ncbi:MAG: carbohydrate-binding module family 20 domain-containing protein, partial [Myxococcales bacterium]
KDFAAWLRVSDDEAAIVAVNRSGRAREVPLPDGVGADARFVDARSGAPLASSGGTSVLAAGGVTVAVARAPGAFRPVAAEAREQARGRGRTATLRFEAASEPHLVAVGSAQALGAWDPAKGLPLSTTGGTELVLPVGGVFEFKLVRRAPGRDAEWEPGENRLLFVTGDGALPATFGRR